MWDKKIKKNKTFYKSMALFLLEGLLSGLNFGVLFQIIPKLMAGRFTWQDIGRYTLLLAIIYGIRNLAYRRAYTLGQFAGTDMSKAIRLDLGNKFKAMPLKVFTQRDMGRYINTVTNDVDNYEGILTHRYGDILKNTVLLLMLTLYLFHFHMYLGWVALASLGLLMPALYYSFKIVDRHGANKNASQANNTDNVVEYITGIQTLRIYGQEGVNNTRIIQSMKDYSRVSFAYELKILPAAGLFNTLMGMSLPLNMALIGLLYTEGVFSAVTAMMVATLPIFFDKLVYTLYIALISYRNLKISKGNIEAIFESQEESVGGRDFKPKTYDIAFERVDFSYDETHWVCQELSFKAESGHLTALVGDSGAGKSTLLGLVAKLYEPQSGAIKIGGIDLADIASEKILDKISMVDQNTFLFNDTIKNNIRIAKPGATDAEIEQVCRLANCHDFIVAEPEGYDTLVGENGNHFSGGERQRISIARALLKDNPIVLLDEATASLDIENELLVKEAIGQLLDAHKTVLMIAHTLPIVKNADQILVMDQGRITESGSHRALMALNGKYAKMYQADSVS